VPWLRRYHPPRRRTASHPEDPRPSRRSRPWSARARMSSWATCRCRAGAAAGSSVRFAPCPPSAAARHLRPPHRGHRSRATRQYLACGVPVPPPEAGRATPASRRRRDPRAESRVLSSGV